MSFFSPTSSSIGLKIHNFPSNKLLPEISPQFHAFNRFPSFAQYAAQKSIWKYLYKGKMEHICTRAAYNSCTKAFKCL